MRRLLGAFLLASSLHAQTPPAQSDSALDARTTKLALQLRCPVCQGESIQESPADLAKQMRDIAREQLRAGKSEDEVKAYFVSKYGQYILLEPKPSGFNLLLYSLPVVLVLGGLVAVTLAVRRWTAQPQES
ncbi:MAG TPA: cytochrome c-type biogenesis protein [Gemmatimonadaceae bacterium]|nr:cytochrome c-type biogenesis protein [Gemmatimonadaceae bacterium]